MIGFGIILMIASACFAIYGINMNNNLEAQFESMWNTGQTDPGTTYIIIGVIAFVIGLILLVAGIKKKQNK